MQVSSNLRFFALCAVLFLASFYLRLYYVHTTEFIEPIRADAYKYFMIAANLLETSTYSYETAPPFTAASYVSPVFPLFVTLHLWLTDSFDKALILLQISHTLLGSLTTVLIFGVAVRCLPLLAAFVIGLLVALSPHFVAFTGYGLTETLFTFLLALHVWLLVTAIQTRRTSVLLMAALIAGLAALTRPVALFLFPALLAVSLYAGWIAPRMAAAALACFIAIMSPWQVLSGQMADKFPPKQSYMAGVIVFGSYPDFIYKSEAYKGYPYREDTEYAYMAQSVGNAVSTIIERAKAEPEKYLYWYLIGKTVSFWSWSMMESMGGPFIYEVGANPLTDTTIGRAGLSVAHLLHTGLSLACLALLTGLVFRLATKKCTREAWRPAVALCATVVLYFTAMHVVLAGWPRYAVPAWPYLYLLGVFAIVYSVRALHRHFRKETVTGAS